MCGIVKPPAFVGNGMVRRQFYTGSTRTRRASEPHKDSSCMPNHQEKTFGTREVIEEMASHYSEHSAFEEIQCSA